MTALGVGLIAESVPHFTYRMLVASGLPALPFCQGIGKNVEDGDNLRVDFASGVIENLTRGTRVETEPLPASLREIIDLGGSIPALKKRLEELNMP
jgi:3-isopropylmalate/(R)-2-methylmalate dehydratase small subunit